VPIAATVAGQVSRVVVTIVPNQAAAVRGYVIISSVSNSGNAVIGERVWVDNLTIETTSARPDGSYFDGSTPAAPPYTYNWTGTPNASTSQRWLQP
jgi:hypothetical protein